MHKNFNGFTLAEVLITLVIIGIIAAMTIPSLINKTNEQETVVAVKKAYSILSQAYLKTVAENGEISPSLSKSDLGELFAKQLNAQKICGTSLDGDCFATDNDGMYKRFNGSDYQSFNKTAGYKMSLSDGMAITIWANGEYRDYGDSEPLKNVLADIVVDVNGHKGPNAFGKDTFKFWVTKYGILPAGMSGDTERPFSTCRTAGDGCTAWVVTNGNMDYLRKEVSW